MLFTATLNASWPFIAFIAIRKRAPIFNSIKEKR